jgi:hypothetical protein
MSRKANASMDDGTVIRDPLAMSAALMTEERAYMAKWLALEILMTDETVCEDEELYGKLSVLQEKWQEQTLARHGVTSTS